MSRQLAPSRLIFNPFLPTSFAIIHLYSLCVCTYKGGCIVPQRPTALVCRLQAALTILYSLGCNNWVCIYIFNECANPTLRTCASAPRPGLLTVHLSDGPCPFPPTSFSQLKCTTWHLGRRQSLQVWLHGGGGIIDWLINDTCSVE